MKKKIKLKNIMIISCLSVIIILLIKTNFSVKSKLVGTWTSDNVTIYEFYKNNKGKLIVSLSEYEFDYSIKNKLLNIDYKNDSAEDSKYSYSFGKNQLILKNKKGIFIFNKK